MIYISFELTMPNVGSWNGKWTGAEKKYYNIRTFSKKDNRPFQLLDNDKSKSWYYNFGDGWGANVRMEMIDRIEANRRKKVSSGFCGYEWMIESILKFNKIQTEGV